MTKYAVTFTVVVDGPEWEDGKQVPKSLLDWPAEVLDEVESTARSLVNDWSFEATNIEVLLEEEDREGLTQV